MQSDWVVAIRFTTGIKQANRSGISEGCPVILGSWNISFLTYSLSRKLIMSDVRIDVR
jgi:hypothetical protein